MKNKKDIISQMNSFGKQGKPFAFLIDFLAEKPLLFPLGKEADSLLFQTPLFSNCITKPQSKTPEEWEIKPPTFKKYLLGFEQIKTHILNGDTYLLNYTQPTKVETNWTLDNIFENSSAPYKIKYKNKFVCFSPEPFVKITNGKISSFPMKGTMDASLPNAQELILNDSKELAEHHTIVDLIRNDLSLVANQVRVEKFRYLERIKTNKRDLWQVSSQITGKLPENYTDTLGEIIFTMLPAGSISGAPKKKTVEIIVKNEKYNRGYYTGIFGVFDGENLDSCVLIRFIENNKGKLTYKSGGGITFMSDAKKEYQEMINKVYVPTA